MLPSSSRNPWLDATKGAACLAIVVHHLSAYGPISSTVWPLAPQLMAWFYDYARIAVQIFLVIGGYLAAASLSAGQVDGAAARIARRFVRLSVPYAAALLLAVAAAALVRPWLADPSVPDSPQFGQLLANALMLQDLLGQPALSAGVWYVAIDFQLYALAVVLLGLARRMGRDCPDNAARWAKGLVLALCSGSLLIFNRFAVLDAWALYFFGSYGLGMATYWAVQNRRPVRCLLGLVVLVTLALVLEFRLRILVALATSMWLAWVALQARSSPDSGRQWLATPLAWVGKRSYSIFLIHFPVCLLVNAAFQNTWPEEPLVHALGLLTAVALSTAAGWMLYERVERRGASAWQALRWEARLIGGGSLVALTSGWL